MTELERAMDVMHEIRHEIARLQEEMRPYVEAEAEARSRIQELMQAVNAKTVEHAGLQAQRASRSTTVITDKDELTAALKERGLYDQCVRLDLNEAKKVGIANEMPGVEKQTNEVFSIRESKK